MLESLVSPLITLIKCWVRKQSAAKCYSITNDIKLCFSILNYIIKLRGYKTVVRFFPHEVSDMEPVTEMLAQLSSTLEYYVPYVLVLWMSIIVLVPFDLTTIDSADQHNQQILVQRIIAIARQWIDSSGKIRDGATLILSKLITRPDVVKSGQTDLLME